MKKLSDPNEKIELANLLAVFRLEMKKLREQLNKRAIFAAIVASKPQNHTEVSVPTVHIPINVTNLSKHKNTLQPISRRVFVPVVKC